MMGGTVLTTALIVSALGCGAIAGIYYAFSGFIMRALDTTGTVPATDAMIAINRVILGSGFMVLFFGTTLLSLLLLVAALIQRPAGQWLIIGSAAIYLIGMLGVTMLRSVPLNQQLAAEGAQMWPAYLRHWTFWNHVRTVASIIAAAGFCLALLQTRA